MKRKTLLTLAVISILVFTAYQLNIQFFNINSKLETNSLRDSDENEFEEEEGEKDPGWHEEWFNSRKNEDGVIPRGLRNRWYAHDKLQISSLKSSNTSNLSDVQELGPFDVGGRTRAILVDQSNSNRIFAGGVSGGLWRSIDAGNNWTPINDQSASMAISCITQNPFSNNVIYYGTGEGYSAASADIPGGGIYKSTDGGNSFSLLSNTDNSDFDFTTSIANSRTQSNTVVAGTKGNGVWRTTNGGTSWSQVLNTPNRIDEVLALPNGRFFVSINGDGIYRSTNNGASFTKLTSGLPAISGFYNRVEIAFCLNTQNTLYAVIADGQNVTKGVYRTDDGGNNWTQLTVPDTSTNFTWYCYMIGVDPNNPDRVVVGAQWSYYSEDGGNSWTSLNTGHADNHVVAIDENNQNTFYIGNDGGIYGKNWNSLSSNAIDLNNGYHVTQFYGGDYYPTGDNFVGGTQDNGTNRRLNDAQKFILWGDGGYSQVSLQDGNLGYVETQNGNIRRSTNIQATNPNYTNIYTNIPHTDGDHFIAPFEINRADGKQVYFCTTSRIWRTTNRGDSWTAVSGSHSSMRAIGVSNATNPTIYYGGSNGNIYRLDNAATNSAANEVDLTASVPSAVTNHFISDIKPHPTNNTIAYVTFSSTDNAPRVYRLNNSNTASPSWTSIHGNLPQGLPCNSMEVDPSNDQNLFVGTDFGLYYTSDGGNSWIKETDIPNVPVAQVQLRASDKNLFVFTHGRGIFNSPIGGSPTSVSFNSCPGDITVQAAQGANSAPANWSTPSASTTCNGSATVSQTAGGSNGSNFNIGTSTVTYQATDNCGNAATCSFTVTVTSVPGGSLELDCPNNITVTTAQGANGATVNWSAPTATTDCNVGGGCNGNAISDFTYMGELNGSEYYLSQSSQKWTDAKATCEDNGGHLATISSAAENAFIFNNPNLNNAVLIGISAENQTSPLEWVTGESISYTNWNTSSNQPNLNGQNLYGLLNYWTSDGKWQIVNYWTSKPFVMEIPCSGGGNSTPTITQTQGPTSGSFFNVGTTTVGYTASDNCNNTDNCTFTVTVQGNPSVLSFNNCPADFTVTAPSGAGGMVVNWTVPTASTSCNGGATVTQINGVSNGSFLSIGNYIIRYRATDNCGNTEDCQFTIIVESNPVGTCNISLPNTCTADLVCANLSGNVLSVNTNGNSFDVIAIHNTDYSVHESLCDFWPGGKPDCTDILTSSALPNGNYLLKAPEASGGNCWIPFSVGSVPRLTSDEVPLMLYPNPVKDVLYIVLPESVTTSQDDSAQFIITNALGQQIQTMPYRSGEREQTLDVSGFTKGLYFVLLKGENYRTQATKFMVN